MSERCYILESCNRQYSRLSGDYIKGWFMMKTYLPKVSEMEQKCYVIDAKDKILGKVAAKAAELF